MSTTTIKMTCKPFSTDGRGRWSLRVDMESREVWVWDDVSHTWTPLHTLTPRACATALGLARKKAKELRL